MMQGTNVDCFALFPQFHCKVGNSTVFKKKIEIALDQELDVSVQRKQETM